MPAVSPKDGPVAVTGASGYIGSWIVRDFAEQGYTVHACVRDANNRAKVDHLLALNSEGLPGQVQLFEADLQKAGSYDAAFRSCCAVIHAGAAVGFNGEKPQVVYDGCFTEVQHVLDSVKKAGGAVKRFVFTSSFAAVYDPRGSEHVFTETDWSGSYPDGWRGLWTEDNIPKVRDIAYAMAKARSEKLVYAAAEEDGSFEAMSICPLHVVGPLMCTNHDQPGSFQHKLRDMLRGKTSVPSFWNLTDVRDTARAHRLCAESSTGRNGSRYITAAADTDGELSTLQIKAKLAEFFPDQRVELEDTTKKPIKPFGRCYCRLAKQELGLTTYTADESLKATGASIVRLGLANPEARL